MLAKQVPHLQSIFLWLFWRWVSQNASLGWSQTEILSISASQVARIIGMSHWYSAQTIDLIMPHET
jgi:hypothetical protein